MCEAENDSAKKLSEFVPELYFDLISRVIPGAVTLTIYLWSGQIDKVSSLSVGMIFLFFSYFLGFVADASSRPLTIFFENTVDRYDRNRSLMSAISQLKPNQHGVMKKLLAESNLFRVSAVL